MGVILLATECIGFFQLVIFYTLVWKEKKRSPVPLQDKDHRPTVDILIATYNEERHVLKKTVSGCLNLDYPKELVNVYCAMTEDAPIFKSWLKNLAFTI